MDRGGDGGRDRITCGGEEGRGRRGMTRGGYWRDASGGGTAGESYGPRVFSNFESLNRGGSGPSYVGRFHNMLGQFNEGMGKQKPAHYNIINSGGSDAKWAFLFKRPVKSRLVEIKSRKWARIGDPGGGTSFKGVFLPEIITGWKQSVKIEMAQLKFCDE